MKKPLILPQFKSEEEEIAFWETIDITEYYESSDFKRVYSATAIPTEAVALSIPIGVVSDLKAIAQKQHVSYQEVMQKYIYKGLEQDKLVLHDAVNK